MPEDTERDLRPIERREIRGLTLESILKYGSIIVTFIISVYLMRVEVQNNTLRIEQLEKENVKKDKEIEYLKIKVEITETWKARTEEQLKYQ